MPQEAVQLAKCPKCNAGYYSSLLRVEKRVEISSGCDCHPHHHRKWILASAYSSAVHCSISTPNSIILVVQALLNISEHQIGHRSVFHNGMIMWNSLPDIFKVNISFSMFKSKVRNFYLEKYQKILMLGATMIAFFATAIFD